MKWLSVIEMKVVAVRGKYRRNQRLNMDEPTLSPSLTRSPLCIKDSGFEDRTYPETTKRTGTAR